MASGFLIGSVQNSERNGLRTYKILVALLISPHHLAHSDQAVWGFFLTSSLKKTPILQYIDKPKSVIRIWCFCGHICKLLIHIL